jgi:hypothetical protein
MKSTVLDYQDENSKEWIKLLKEARHLRILPEEIRRFLHSALPVSPLPEDEKTLNPSLIS